MVTEPGYSGTAAATLGRLRIASASSATRVAVMPSARRMLGAPGRTSSRLVPMALMRSSTDLRAPSPIASIATTDATPMMMPSRVSRVRNRLLRSEEHTSELQSLMRISYAVFCLKKKNHQQTNQQQQTSYVNTNHDENTQRLESINHNKH